ncbi:MAG: tRNA (adenosine(37)-N6)-threonylcarbamoyltransferase complex ATPase subunit type 1 TsaE [Patescibacteria group bacterium]
MKLVSKSEKETRNFALRLARNIAGLAQDKHAVVLSLEGDLGAGKTAFTKGFAEGLGIKEKIQSPTFVILKIYRVKGIGARVKRLVHVDAYRLKPKDFKVLGWKEFIKNPQNIILVEWGNKIKSILPKNSLRITFEHGKNSKERIIIISDIKSEGWEKIVDFGKVGISAKKFLRRIRQE